MVKQAASGKLSTAVGDFFQTKDKETLLFMYIRYSNFVDVHQRRWVERLLTGE